MMAKNQAEIPIDSCQKCPFLDERAFYTADSWERPHDWFCKHPESIKVKAGGREIAGYVDWYEEKNVEIPKWCPILKK